MGFANLLTLSRIFLVPIFIWFIIQDKMITYWAAFLIFIIAALTDYYDGWIARRFREISNFGKILDPVADKILVISALVIFVMYDVIPPWMVIIIVSREFLITSIRFFALTQNQVLAAERSGKHKTISQMTAIISTLLVLAISSTTEHYPALALWFASGSIFATPLNEFVKYGPYWLMFIATVFSITSGVDFVWKNKKLFYKELL